MIRARINRLAVVCQHARLFELGSLPGIRVVRNFSYISLLAAQTLVTGPAECQTVVNGQQSSTEPAEIFSSKLGVGQKNAGDLTDDRLFTEMSPTIRLASSGFGPTEELSLLTLSFKMAVGLACVVMLVWGTVYLIRRSGIGQQFTQVGSSVKILERSYLAPKKTIVLVGIGDRTLALGVTDSNINVLHTWQPGEIVLSADNRTQSTFASQFRSLVQRRYSEDHEQMPKDSTEKAGL